VLAWFSRKIDLYTVLDRWREAGSNYEPGRPVDKSWYVDRYEVALGTSEEDALFDKAVRRLFQYAYYPESFVAVAATFIRDERPPEAGERIVQRVRVIPGILDAVTMNIVSSVWQEPDRKGFALITSEQQYESGEWTASVVRNPDGEVLLLVTVVSKPSKRLLFPGRVFARALQKHAHSLALKTFRNAVGGVP
jgi:uncharacterized protein (UPF0548 family)